MSSKQADLSALFRAAGAEAKLKASQAADEADVPDEPGIVRPRKLKIFNVLEYIESSWGLGMTLFPVQRFLVKLYYHLPLNDRDKTIEVTDMLKTKVLYTFTEKEYLKFLYEEGRCNIGVQDHERRELVLAIGRRAGKCLREGSLVLTDKGICRIEDLGQASNECFSQVDLGVVQEGGRRSRAAAFYNGGVKPTYEIETDSGYTITGTGNHRIKVMTPSGKVEWQYLDEIKPGDFVALNRSTDMWVTEELDLRPYHNDDGYKDVALPASLDERVGNLMGYLVGDGTWGDGHSVAVTVEHPETWDHLTKLFSEVFGQPRVQMDKRTANTGRLEFCSVRARRFLDALGWKSDCARDEKMIPWAILRSPRAVVCAFLRGLFESDGCAESDGRHITFSSASFRLAHEIQVVLLNLGIVSNLARRWNAKTKHHYASLSIKGVRSRRRFAEIVGFDSDKKRRPMMEALEVAQEGKSDTESIPHQRQRVRDWLESVPKRNPACGELGWGRTKLRIATGNVHKGSGEDFTYGKLGRALDVAKTLPVGVAETAHFEELLRLDYFYDVVTSVKTGEGQVYDLTVPDGQSFVANGMTNHNTTLSGIFASYEVYRLLNLHHPQGYYGLPPGNRIQIISVATDKDQAGLLFTEVTAHLARCDYFKPFIASNTLSDIKFRTPHDIEKFGDVTRFKDGKFQSLNGKATIRVTFKSCVAKGLRGSGNVVIILDEMAHFLNEGQSSAKDIYDAVSPSAAAFSPKDPSDSTKPIGPVESRIIAISSPLNKTGKFYELFHLAMSKGKGSENLLAIQAPTWEVNPTIAPSYYSQKYHADPAVFMTEHGAQFSDRVRGWIEREQDLMECVNPARRPMLSGLPRQPHQMGIDVGLTNDGTAFAITTVEDDRIVLAYHELWEAGKDWRESNPHLAETGYSCDYVRNLTTTNQLDFDEIANWIEKLTRRFHITDGLFDRWNGLPLQQTLNKKGLSQFKSEFFTRDATSKMYQAVKSLMQDKKLELYDYPVPEKGAVLRHSPLIAEMLTLQAEQMSRNIVIVQAPQGVGYHDDQSDAVIRAMWLTLERMSNTKHVFGAQVQGAGGASTATVGRYQLQRAKAHGGYTTDRMVPRSLGLRMGRRR